MIGKLNPFRGLSNAREVFAWGLYDLANQSFTLLIITLLFPIYLTTHIIGDEQRGSSIWSLFQGLSLMAVVLISPAAGVTADAFGLKRRLLVGTGVICGTLTVALGFTGPGHLWTAAVLFVAANVAFQVGENFLASFLPEISTPRNVGRVSATGWTMGYIGALLLLVVTAVVMAVTKLPIERWGVLFIMAGLWFLAGIVYPAWVLREGPPADPEARRRGTAMTAFRRLACTARDAVKMPDMTKFLVAFFVYALGIQVVVAFAGIIAKEDFGFGQTKLVLFVLQLTVTAGVASALTGFFQDRIGGRSTVLLYLGIWIVSTGGLLWLTLTPSGERPEAYFWLVGNGVGFALGGAGAASRGLVARFTPACRTAEFFGLWGMTYKLAGAIGVLAFGQVRAYIGNGPSVSMLLGFFVVGFVLTWLVNERCGMRAAMRIDRDFGRSAVAPPAPTTIAA